MYVYLVLQYRSHENHKAAHKGLVMFMILQLFTCETLCCYSSFSPCSLRKTKEKMSEDAAEPVLDDENFTFQDDPNKCKYQAEIQRYSFI